MPKKAKAPKKARNKRGEAGSRYDALKAAWDARHKDPAHTGGDNWLVDMTKLPVDAGPFLRTLRVLGDVTQDRRYDELRRAIVASGMIDRSTGHWSRYGVTLARPDTRTMCEMIEDIIADETSERLAIAEAVAELAFTGQSFEAACKSVKRLLEHHRKLP